MRRVNTAPPLARRIGVLVYPGIELLDAIGPLEVFAATNRVVQERDAGAAAPYAVEIWAAEIGDAWAWEEAVGACRSIERPPCALET